MSNAVSLDLRAEYLTNELRAAAKHVGLAVLVCADDPEHDYRDTVHINGYRIEIYQEHGGICWTVWGKPHGVIGAFKTGLWTNDTQGEILALIA